VGEKGRYFDHKESSLLGSQLLFPPPHSPNKLFLHDCVVFMGSSTKGNKKCALPNMHTMFGGQRALKKKEANLSKALSKAQLSHVRLLVLMEKGHKNLTCIY
jgi:hypothetical protein